MGSGESSRPERSGAARPEGTPASRDGAPGTVDGAPGTVDGAPGTVDDAPGTVDDAPGTVDGAPGTVDGAPGTVDGAPGTGDDAPETMDGAMGSIVGFTSVAWATFVLGFFSAPVSTRLYSPDIVGRLNLFTSWTYLVASIVFLGLDQAFVRFYHEPPGGVSPKVLFTFCTIVPLAALVALLPAGMLFPADLAFLVGGTRAPGILALFFVNTASAVTLRFLFLSFRMRNHVVRFAVLGILEAAVSRLLYLVAGVFDPSFEPAVIAMCVSRSLVMLAFLFLTRGEFRFSRSMTKPAFTGEIARFALPIAPGAILSHSGGMVSKLVLSSTIGFSGVGLFSVAVGLAGILSAVYSGFSTWWSPYAFRSYRTEGDRFDRVHRALVCCIVLAGLALVALQDPFFMLVGDKYREAKRFFPFLLVAPACGAIGETTGIGIAIAKKTGWNIFLIVVGMVANLLLCLALIPGLGITGAALGSALASVVVLAVRSVLGRRFYRSVASFAPMAWGIGLLVISASVAVVPWKNDGIMRAMHALLLAGGAALYRREIAGMAKAALCRIRRR